MSELKHQLMLNKEMSWVPCYLKSDVDATIDELKENISEYKAREDVLVTDNKNLLDRVKVLENSLRENAEHYKRNEAQILENADKVIADKDAMIAELQKQVHDYAQGLYVIQARAEKEVRRHKYKRCMAMAKWCESTALWCWQAANTLPAGFHATLYGKRVMIEPDRLFKRFERLTKWQARWLKLAEKFKPNKEAK